jgi:hypothetical protein
LIEEPAQATDELPGECAGDADAHRAEQGAGQLSKTDESSESSEDRADENKKDDTHGRSLVKRLFRVFQATERQVTAIEVGRDIRRKRVTLLSSASTPAA